MKTQEGSKNKMEVDSDDEVNFGISNDVLCVDMSRGGEWVLDSGACFHICNQREAFTDYKEEVCKVESANGGDLHVQGIGSVRLKMDTGRMATLTGVRHILEIKRNLVSIGQLEGKGCNFSTRGGVMRV